MASEKRLEILSVIGFAGGVKNGFLVHPNNNHLIYPLGTTVIIREKTQVQTRDFLRGHTNSVSCLAISKDGRFIASGQITHMGFQADIIVWDFEQRKLIWRFNLHKVKVQALTFSPSGKYLASLGGEDDKSVIVWDLEKGAAICGSPASQDSGGSVYCLSWLNHNENVFVTGGQGNIRVWELNTQTRKIKPTESQTGQLKRSVNCLAVDSNDEFMYCGTSTGDVLQVNIRTKLFKLCGPPKQKDLFQNGVMCIQLAHNDEHVVVGCGDGTVAMMKTANLAIVK